MKLKDIFFNCNIKLDENVEEIEIKDIKIDPNEVCRGDLFFDLKAKENLNAIFAKGASFVVRLGRKTKIEKKVLSVKDVRHIFALASKNFYKKACDKLKIIGITGTNGKTSAVKLVADILENCGKVVGRIGTFGCIYLNNHIETGFTTPDPHILHNLFHKMQKSGVEYVVMEVSAHSIALKKLDGIKFECLALTNITEDHLDFFENMENYSSTKLSFFTAEHAKQGVVCADDNYFFKLTEMSNIPLVSYGVNCPSDIFAIDIDSNFNGTSFICNCLDEIMNVKTELIGEYNVLNSLCAIGITRLLGFDCRQINKGIRRSSPEIGRFNVIKQNGINVIVDYAHTPDGLQKVLITAKSLCLGKLYVLFGCGGNRDPLKRGIMGSVAEMYADYVFLTSDNPRFEDPEKIIDDIESGMVKKNHEREVDRKISIEKALGVCKNGDCLIIAGKGGENYQDIKGQKTAYSDFDEVYKFFRKEFKLIDVGDNLKHGS